VFTFTKDVVMDTNDIAEMRTNWKRFLRRFDSCASDQETRHYFRIYMEGLMSELPRKNCEAMALDSGVPVRSMQWFLAGMVWNHERMRNKLQRIVAKEHAGKHSVGVIDETSFVKKGKMTPGVQHSLYNTSRYEIFAPGPKESQAQARSCIR